MSTTLGRPPKIDTDQFAQIRAAYAQGAKQRDLAQQYDISQPYISKIVEGIPKVRASSRKPQRCCVGCGVPLRHKTRCEPCNRKHRNEKEKKRLADLRAAKREEA